MGKKASLRRSTKSPKEEKSQADYGAKLARQANIEFRVCATDFQNGFGNVCDDKCEDDENVLMCTELAFSYGLLTQNHLLLSARKVANLSFFSKEPIFFRKHLAATRLSSSYVYSEPPKRPNDDEGVLGFAERKVKNVHCSTMSKCPF